MPLNRTPSPPPASDIVPCREFFYKCASEGTVGIVPLGKRSGSTYVIFALNHAVKGVSVMDKFAHNRFLALFDIMGFTDLVYRNPHKEVLEVIDKVRKFADDVQASNTASLIFPKIFSDSILFVSDGDTDEDFAKIVYNADLFLGTMLEQGVPVKGAISHGLFTAWHEKSIFVGRPLVDAYVLAKDLKFYGAIFHHTMEKFIVRNTGVFSTWISKGKIPMTEGRVEHAYLNLSGERVRVFNSPDYEVKLRRFYDTVSGPVRKYVDNTIEVYCQ